jgi:ABC-type phosphate/phosphonate transport system ATPase subunit
LEETEEELQHLICQQETLTNHQYENQKKTAKFKKLIEMKEEEQKQTLMEALELLNAEVRYCSLV